MNKSLTTIVGLGIVTAIFMAVMSMFYLQQIPTQEDLNRLEDELRREHGIYLAAASPLDISLLHAEDDAERTGLRIECTMRVDLRKQPRAVELYLQRIADSVMDHPDWTGRIAYVTVAHAPPLTAVVTRHATREAPRAGR